MLKGNFVETLRKLLSYALKDPESAAAVLYDKYRNYRNLAVAEYDELASIPEVGDGGAYIIRLALAASARRETDKFKFGKAHTREDIAEYLKALFYTLSNENVYVLLLDGAGRVTFSEHLGEGTVNASNVLPRKVLELAVKRGARYAILAHNHPSGYAEPSVEDIKITEEIMALFETSGRKLLAHYVMAADDYRVIEFPDEEE